jgi:hypothetical protein
MDTASRTCGFPRPQSTIQGIARCPCGQDLLQSHPVEALSEGLPKGLERGHHAVDGLFISRIGHTLTPTDVTVALNLYDDDVSLGLRTPRNREGRGQWP